MQLTGFSCIESPSRPCSTITKDHDIGLSMLAWGSGVREKGLRGRSDYPDYIFRLNKNIILDSVRLEFTFFSRRLWVYLIQSSKKLTEGGVCK